MKILGAVMVLAAGTMAWAGEVVTACLNPGADGALMQRGEGTASRILKQAGIQVNWRGDPRACGQGAGIVVSLSYETPAGEHAGALAYSQVFEGTHVVLYFDRVKKAAGGSLTPYLLGHVLAHEIIHMLQRVERHSAEGVMKARWDVRDFADMQVGRLRLTDEDIRLIRAGVADDRSIMSERK